MIHATIDNRIRVPLGDLGRGTVQQLKDALHIVNVEKIKAVQAGVPDADDLPNFFDLWEIDNEEFTMPRGFLYEFEDGMDALGQEIAWDDRRTYRAKFRVGRKIDFGQRVGFQQPALEAILAQQNLIYQAPTGSGKTVVALALIRRLTCKSIVLVNTKDILGQWIERVREYLGPEFPVGKVGDGAFEVSPYLTIATVQTLWSRRRDLIADGFFDQFGCAILDECHHATARTFREIFDLFKARYRVGLSATPEKTGSFDLAQYTIGPIGHVTTEEELEVAGVRIRPSVLRIDTPFKFKYHGAHNGRPSNYPQLIQKLIRHPERNLIIVKTLLAMEDHYQLVLTKRLEHIAILEGMLNQAGYGGQFFRYTGKESGKRRNEIAELAKGGPCVIISTLADEAVDIPILDRVHLAFPQRNTDLIKQQIGRGVRIYPGKEDMLVIDYADMKVGVIKNQFKGRVRHVYKPMRMSIEQIDAKEVLEWQG